MICARCGVVATDSKGWRHARLELCPPVEEDDASETLADDLVCPACAESLREAVNDDGYGDDPPHT